MCILIFLYESLQYMYVYHLTSAFLQHDGISVCLCNSSNLCSNYIVINGGINDEHTDEGDKYFA